MSSFFVTKDRKVKFACVLIIHQLDNLPYLAGQYFAKWKLTYTTLKGVTSRATVNNYTVHWDAVFTFEETLIISKTGFLKPHDLEIVIKQEIDGGEYSERLGTVNFNISDFAKCETKTEKYLLQNAKSNSILKITLQMHIIEGKENQFKSNGNIFMTPVSEEEGTATTDASDSLKYKFDQLDDIDPENSEAVLIDSFFNRARKDLENETDSISDSISESNTGGSDQ